DVITVDPKLAADAQSVAVDGLWCNAHLVRDLFARLVLGDAYQDGSFLRRQQAQPRNRLGEFLDAANLACKIGSHRRACVNLTRTDRVDAAQDLGGGAILEQIPLYIAPQRLLEHFLLVADRQENQFDAKLRLANSPRHRAAVDLGQADVEDGDVWFQRLNVVERGASVAGLCDDTDARLRLQRPSQAIAKKGMVFSDDDADLVRHRFVP